MGGASGVAMTDDEEPRSAPMAERWAGEQVGSLAPSFGWLKSVTMTDGLLDRIRGSVVGSAVGDALGAPFEFGGPGRYSDRFPVGGSENEMQGGGPWEPGEFTDDTQMAILEAESFVASGGIDEVALFDAFRQWVASGPKDVGVSTGAVLTNQAGWPVSPQSYFRANPDTSAGNGSMMRASFMAVYWGLAANLSGTAEVARRLSVVTHGDPAAGEGRALLHMLVAGELLDKKFAVSPSSGFAHAPGFAHALRLLKDDQRERFADVMEPATDDPISNGTAWGAMRDAARALRGGTDFESTMRIACDVGDDVDTVAAIAGAWAGAKYGLDSIPSRWIEAVNGDVLGRRYDAKALVDLMDRVLTVRTELSFRSTGWQPNVSTVRYGLSEYFDLGG